VFTVTAGSDVRAEHYPHLRFVTAVAKEALRLYPPVWSLGRVATKDCALGSLQVVKGTDLWLCLHRLHRDPRWYPEPERFRPERWLGIKRNGGLPVCHSESALVYASASTSLWLKPYSDWPRCCAGSASRQPPLFLPRSTHGSRFGQEKVSLRAPGPIQRAGMPRRIGAGPLFHAQAAAQQIDGFYSYVFKDIRASTRFMLPQNLIDG
jgi:hypothetical protein